MKQTSYMYRLDWTTTEYNIQQAHKKYYRQ